MWRWNGAGRVILNKPGFVSLLRLLGALGAWREKEAEEPLALHLITFLAGEDHGGGARCDC
jgi:hypothetical protein